MTKLNGKAKTVKMALIISVLAILFYVVVFGIVWCIVQLFITITGEKEYNELINNPPDDLCELEIEYDSSQALPSELTVNGITFIRYSYGCPWGFAANATHTYKYGFENKPMGKLLIREYDKYRTHGGYGYRYAEVRAVFNNQDELSILFFDQSRWVYLSSNLEQDVFECAFSSDCDLFSEYDPIILGSLINSTESFSSTDLYSKKTKMVYADSKADVINEKNGFIFINHLIKKGGIMLVRQDFPVLTVSLEFAYYKESFYVGIGLEASKGDSYFEIQDEKLCELLRGIVFETDN